MVSDRHIGATHGTIAQLVQIPSPVNKSARRNKNSTHVSGDAGRSSCCCCWRAARARSVSCNAVVLPRSPERSERSGRVCSWSPGMHPLHPARSAHPSRPPAPALSRLGPSTHGGPPAQAPRAQWLATPPPPSPGCGGDGATRAGSAAAWSREGGGLSPNLAPKCYNFGSLNCSSEQQSFS